MDCDGYHSDELKSFYKVLDSAISEAKIRRLDLPVAEMTRRLFSAADSGERDPQKLKAVVLAGAATAPADADPWLESAPLPITITSSIPSKRSSSRSANEKSPPVATGTFRLSGFRSEPTE